MKIKVINVIICLFLVSFLACEKEQIKISPGDSITSEYYNISSFEELDIADPFKVEVTFSNAEESLRIEANANLQDRIKVEQRNGSLSISMKENTSFSGPAVLNVFLTTKGFESVRARGAAQVNLLQNWNTDRAMIYLEGASTLDGALNANQLDVQLSGASRLSLAGYAKQFEMSAIGGSQVEGYGLETQMYRAYLRGACNAYLTVHDKLSVEAEGGSKIYYKGDGIIEKQKLSDSSQIIKVE